MYNHYSFLINIKFLLMDNIELLKLEADEIKKSLNELKNNISISEDDKRNKANLLNRRAEKTKQKIQKEIDSLTDKTDEESKKKKEEAEALLNSFNDITTLYNSIINPSSNPWTHDSRTQSSEQTPTENKNIFTTATDWIKTQRNNILDTKKRKEDWRENWFRLAWFAATWIWTLGLAYKWAKSLRNWAFWSDKKKEKTESKKKKKKFGDKWYGKLLKWAGITTAAWGWIYFLGKHFNLWWSTDNNAENQPAQQQDKTTENSEEKSNETKDSKESFQPTSDKISNEMFEQLLKMEGKHKQGNNTLVAKTGKQFWEKFPTWPFGMVYKHIDNEGNLLKKAIPFKEWEEVTEEWGRKNAKACYDKRAKEIKEAFDNKWYKLSQDQLDALTSTCGGTSKSRKNCLNFVLENWNNQKKVVDYISTHSTTAAWNHQVQLGLVYRRKFEADWFVWNKMTFAEHRSMQKKWKNTNPNDSHLA